MDSAHICERGAAVLQRIARVTADDTNEVLARRKLAPVVEVALRVGPA
jgi:hypothetical protein